METKKIIIAILSLLFFYTTTISAQNTDDETPEIDIARYFQVFQNLDISSGYLLNRVFFHFEQIEPYILPPLGSDPTQEVITSAEDWVTLYNYIRVAEVNPSNPLSILAEHYDIPSTNSNEVSIGILNFKADYVHPDSMTYYFLPTPDSILSAEIPLEEANVFAISNLRHAVYFSNVSYKIDPSLLFTNQEVEIFDIDIDFGDGEGFNSYSWNEQTVNIQYPSIGDKSIIYSLNTSAGVFQSSSTIKISESLQVDVQDSIEMIFAGDTLSALYNIYLGCDEVLDRPIIAVKGFEILDRGNPAELYRKYEKADLIETIHNSGSDFISVSFSSAHADIRSNAILLAEVINKINELKIDYFENVLIGESMGGLVARIALKRLEDLGVYHQTRLYVSFDSPHQGANIPLSIQETLSDALEVDASGGLLNRILGSAIIGPFVFIIGDHIIENIIKNKVENKLKGLILEKAVEANEASSSLQMLIRSNYEGGIYSEDYMHKNKNPYHIEFQENLDDIGFPDQLRRVAIINGSNNGQRQINEEDDSYYGLGDYYVNEKKHGIRVYAKTNFVNVANTKTSKIEGRTFLFWKVKKGGTFTFFDKPYDIGPGGISPQGFNFAFIPTVSAIAFDFSMDIDSLGIYYFKESSNNPLRTRKGMVENNLIPFHDVYSASKNTKHVEFVGIMDLAESLVERELMLDVFDLQNQTIQFQEKKSYHAKNLLSVGYDVNHWNDPANEKLINPGNVVLKSGATVKMTSEGAISFQPGFSAMAGSFLSARIVAPLSGCSNQLRTNNRISSDDLVPVPSIKIIPFGGNNVAINLRNPYMKLPPESYHWEITGVDFKVEEKGHFFVLKNLPPGQYMVSCNLENGYRSNSTVFIVNGIPTETQSEEETKMTASEVPITLYPNPVNNILKWNNAEAYDLLIVNTLGQVEMKLHNVNSADVSMLSSGYYLAILRKPGQSHVKGIPFFKE